LDRNQAPPSRPSTTLVLDTPKAAEISDLDAHEHLAHLFDWHEHAPRLRNFDPDLLTDAAPASLRAKVTLAGEISEIRSPVLSMRGRLNAT
jgi:hypothetical protein